MRDWIDFSLALSVTTWVIHFNTLMKEYNTSSRICYSGGGSVYFRLLPKASWVLPLSCLGFGKGWECSASDRMGTRKYGKGSVSSCAFPSSRRHTLWNSPRLTTDWLSTLTVKKWGQAEPDTYICTFFCQCALSLFHYLRAPEEHMLMRRKWLSKQKGRSELEPWSRENLRFAGFNSGKRRTWPFLGAAAMLLVPWAVALGDSILVAHVRRSGCVSAVEAQLWAYKQLWTGMCPATPLSSVIQGIGPLQGIVTPWWNYPDLPFCWAESCLSA